MGLESEWDVVGSLVGEKHVIDRESESEKWKFGSS